jgi:CRISPR/Cas system CSM-associated protein Csm2 small subunit
MFQLVATKHRCKFSMKNGRENRNNGNQEEGKEEKEALRMQYEVKRGRQLRPLSFCGSEFFIGVLLSLPA